MQMRKTTQQVIDEKTILITTSELMTVLHCGRTSACRIGRDADALVQIGKRTLWNFPKVKSYINAISL